MRAVRTGVHDMVTKQIVDKENPVVVRQWLNYVSTAWNNRALN